MTGNTCPFGQKLQKYWDKRYQLFSKFDEGIQIDEEGLFSVTPEVLALGQAKRLKELGYKSVIDAFCGVGGNAIAFASIISKIYAVELNAKRLSMAENNAKIYNVKSKIKFMKGDSLEIVKNIHADAIYLDPPWGGSEYMKIKKFRLNNFRPDITNLLQYCLKHFRVVVLKVPTNFDLKQFDMFNIPFEVINETLDGRIYFRTVYFRKKL